MNRDDTLPSTRPYLIRALHEWCTDNGFAPYLAVQVDGSVQVPREFVKNNEIVLNVSFDATSGLKLGNEYVEFKARFGGVARDILVPVSHVVAIYARENGQGMAFPPPPTPVPQPSPATAGAGAQGDESKALQLVKGDGTAGDAAKSEAKPQGSKPQDQPPPPPSAPPSGPRPALKRIK